ncbi:hypothetical protein RF11_09904 [Thelohanellus kitauei]|uniref:Uncharacterized protein n=1 Tax=Thelohanellus kitauei TaxID=669202 RepID=A0A0C2J3K9_THEKT|nr:hypothetical protein RF11_09904 [Thelohanellus kitauei]
MTYVETNRQFVVMTYLDYNYLNEHFYIQKLDFPWKTRILRTIHIKGSKAVNGQSETHAGVGYTQKATSKIYRKYEETRKTQDNKIGGPSSKTVKDVHYDRIE